MKFTIIACTIFLFTALLPAQEPLAIPGGCHFDGADSLRELYTYAASAEAVQIVESIMKVNVLPQNFVVRAADCSNALATTIGNQRYILYNTAFLENFKKEARTQWAAYSVLAHEIGHHLSNHDMEETNPSIRKRYELEADKFAGGILYRLGATLEDAQAGINTFSSDNGSATHPPKRARLEALAVGWKQAEEMAAAAENTAGSAAADSDEKKLYNQALAENDPYKAIDLLDQAIELKEDFADAYRERGKRKIDIEQVDEIRVNFQDAANDYTVYLQMRPKDPVAYAERGYAWRRLDRDSQALADYNRAIRLNSKYAEAYLGRAWVKMKIDDNDAALKDLEKAGQLDPKLAAAYYWHGNILYFNGEYAAAITDLDQALNADPAYTDALDLRAAAKQYSNQYSAAVEDFNKLQKLDSAAFNSYLNRGICYQSLGKHAEAIADFDAHLKRYEGSSDAWLYRGVSHSVLGNKVEAAKDFDQAFSNTVLVVNSSIKIGCLLVDYGLPQDGLVWLDKALAKAPDNRQAQECRQKALKK